jgi:hypothetical protein
MNNKIYQDNMEELRKKKPNHSYFNYYLEDYYLDGKKKGVYSTYCNIFINQ